MARSLSADLRRRERISEKARRSTAQRIARYERRDWKEVYRSRWPDENPDYDLRNSEMLDRKRRR